MRGLEAPDKIKIFSSSVQWIFQPSQCFVNIATLKMATECHEDGRLNTLSLVFVRDSAPHPFQNFIFWEELSLSSIFQFPGQQLEQVLVDIVLSPKILICLPEQLWVGQATGACLYTATHEAFAPCPQLINLLRSSNFTLSSLHVHNISTHVPPQMHSISTPMSLHVHEPWASISSHVPPQVHSVSTPMSLMYMNHKQTYPLTYHHKCTAYQHLCRFMYMNHK